MLAALAVLALPAALAAQPAAERVVKPEVESEWLDVQKRAGKFFVDLEQAGATEIKRIGAAGVEAVPANMAEVELSAAEVVARRVPGEATRVEPRGSESTEERWILPYQIVGVDASGATFEIEPLVRVDRGGLRPAAGGGFLGRIHAAVREVGGGGSRALPRPIEMLITGDVDTIEPERLLLSDTNVFKAVELAAASPAADRVRIRLSPSFDPEGTEIELPVNRGTLRLTVSPRTIQGLGLETARLTVRATGLPRPEGVEVSLGSDRGRLEGEPLVLSAAGSASTSIRSVTTGVATVTAEALGLVPAQTDVRFVFPWLFLVAALLGGAAGAAIRRARSASDTRRKLWVELVVLGGLVGVLVAAAYSVGINLLAVSPAAGAGEALVFVLAALGAFWGIPGRRSSAEPVEGGLIEPRAPAAPGAPDAGEPGGPADPAAPEAP